MSLSILGSPERISIRVAAGVLFVNAVSLQLSGPGVRISISLLNHVVLLGALVASCTLDARAASESRGANRASL